MKTIQNVCMSFVIAAMGLTTAGAQTLTTPMASPKAMVKQTVGITDMKVIYHRPAVKDRTVWGDLVAYDEVWRAGANDNTIVWFKNDVQVEGKALKAGAYGLHMIPSKSDWTIIFSSNSSSWGSYSYNEEEDALRVKVTPRSAHHQENLMYYFDHVSNEGASLVMHWEKMQVPMNITVDTKELVYANMQNEIRHLAGYSWQGWNTMANYCLKNDMHLDKAVKYSEKAMKYNKNFTTMTTHSKLLAKNGDAEGAKKYEMKAVEVASNNELNMHGYQLANAGKYDEALKAFKMNTEKNGDDPNVWDSLGEGYAMAGDKKNAIKYFKKSLSMNPPEGTMKNSIKYLKKYGVDTSQYEKELSKR